MGDRKLGLGLVSIIVAVGLLGTSIGDGPHLEIAVDLGTTLGDGPPLDIVDIWMWILEGTCLWMLMLAGTGLK